MRHLIAALLVSTALPVSADTFNLNSSPQHALITGQGGIVTRTTDLSLPEGRHVLNLRLAALPDLPPKIAFSGSNAPILRSAQMIDEYAAPLPFDEKPALAPLRQAVEVAQAALSTHDEQAATIVAQIEAAEIRLKLLSKTADRGLDGGDQPLTADQLLTVVTEMGTLTQKANTEKAAAQTALNTLQRNRSDLAEKLRIAEETLAAEMPEQSQLPIWSFAVDVPQDWTGTLSIEEFAGIGWTPTYDLDVTQTEATGILELTRKATLHQTYAENARRGESWENVSIVLSTANLNDKTNTQIPWPDILRLVDPSIQKRKISTQAYSLEMDMAEPVVNVAETDGFAARPTANFSGQTVLFDMGGGHSISWKTDASAFTIDTLDIPVDLYAMANAARDEFPFLYTDLKNETGGILLAGNVTLRREGTLIGATRLPELLPGQTEPLGLGPLYGIQIQHDTLSVEEGDSGFISSQSEIERSYRTTVTSTLEYNMPFKLLDVIPTSENEDLVIRMNAKPKPTEENRDGKRGVLVWEFDLQPSTSEVVNFEYEMSWPSGNVPVR